jgi:hypothetical protein
MKRFEAAAALAVMCAAVGGGCTNGGAADGLTVRQGAVTSTAPVELQVLTNTCGANQAQDFFQVINHSTAPVTVSDISIKLWVDETSASNVVAQINTGGCLLNASGSCVHNVTGVTATATKFSPACGPDPSHQANWEVTISNADPSTLGAGLIWSNIQVALQLANFANFTPGEASWYSACLPGSKYVDAATYAVYVAGSLVRSSTGVPPVCRAPKGSQQLTNEIPPGVAPSNLVGSLPGTAQLTFSIGLPLNNQSGLQSLVQQLSDPKSPQYRKYLTPSGFGAAYGATQSNYNAVVSFAQSNGLTVKTLPNLARLQVTGTVADIERAFFVTLNMYKRGDGTTFYAPANQPSVNLGVPLLYLSGLTNFPPKIKALHGGGTGPNTCISRNSLGTILDPDPGSYIADDFRNLYFPDCGLDGTGQTVGLFELGDYYDVEIARYEASTSFATAPSPSIVRVPSGTALPPITPVTAVTPCPLASTSFNFDFLPSCFQSALLPNDLGPAEFEAGSDGEVALDIEMVVAMAPKANIRVYEGEDALQILDTMANDDASVRPSAISSSWMWFNGNPDPNIANVFLQYAAQGQSFFIAAGDQGAYIPGGANQIVLDPIIDSSLMTVVGGTELATTAAGTYQGEMVWNDSQFEALSAPCTGIQCGVNTVSSGGLVNGYTVCEDLTTQLLVVEPIGTQSSSTLSCGASYSALPIPSYQQNMPAYLTSAASAAGQLSTTTRMIPDVSIVGNNIYDYVDVLIAADASSGPVTRGPVTVPVGDYQVFTPDGNCSGGTSASAPLWAAIAAMANQQQAAISQPPIGFANPTLYALAAASPSSYANFHDITVGSNFYTGNPGPSRYAAVAGYDLASGLGTPNGTSCSPLNVIPPQSCQPGNSLSALITGGNVTAFMPNGSYSQPSTGVSVVPIEGAGSPAQLATPGVVNTCAGNSQTGEVVCTANDLDVYLINGAASPPAITSTLQSGATAAQDETSGGFCQTCDVAIDPLHNKAYLSIATGTSTSPGAAFQPLDLATGALGTPIPVTPGSSPTFEVGTSEGVLVDGLRGFVLSPNEGDQSLANTPGDYELVNTSTGHVFDWINPPGVPGGAPATSPPDTCNVGSVFDSAAEDCTTGIALATLEFSDQLFLLDLTRATFDSVHSTWSAPSQYVTIPELRPFVCTASGTDGISIAPNSHLGAVAGEFGGNDFLAIQLPATAGGSGTTPPSLVDYVYAQLPSTPDGKAWQSGRDPHTLTTYTSPTNGRAYAVFEDDAFLDGTRTYLAVVDLAAMVNPTISTRGGASPHTVAAPSTCGGPGPNPTGSVPPSVPQCTIRYVPIGAVSVGPSGGTALPVLPP